MEDKKLVGDLEADLEQIGLLKNKIDQYLVWGIYKLTSYWHPKLVFRRFCFPVNFKRNRVLLGDFPKRKP